jgi:hypothetical protein
MPVDVPDDVAAGDIIVVTAFIDGATTVTGLATDFAQAPDSPVHVVADQQHRQYVMWKRAAAADNTASTYDFALSGSAYRNVQAIRYTGAVASGDPWDATDPATDDTNGTASPPVEDTTTGADRLIIWSSTNWAGGAWTPPTDFTERRDTGDQVCAVADKAQAVAGATGSISGSCTGSGKRTAWLGALKPGGGSATSPPLRPRQQFGALVQM